jgi:cytochrome c2
MKRAVRSITYGFLGCSVAAAALLAVPHATAQEKTAKVDGKSLFEQKCLKCHKVEKFKSQHNSRSEWETILSRMERNSCVLSEAEATALSDYLAKQYGK